MPRKLTETEKKKLIEVSRCSNDFWKFNKHCKTYDVNAKEEENPIKSAPEWKYLKKLFGELESQSRIVILKTRQLFFSTFLMLWLLWKLMYARRPLQIIVLSESLKKAYDGTKKSLLGRLEFAHKHLPDHLRQQITIKKHPQVVFENARNGVSITASATTDDAGRGDSYDIAIVDEYAWHDYHVAKDLPSSLSVNVKKLIFLSTPRGKNHFWELVENVKKGIMKMFFVEYNWHNCVDDPDRLELYNRMLESMLPADREREMNASFEDSQEGKVFDFVRSELETRDPLPTIAELLRMDVIGGMDVAIGDCNAITLGYMKGEVCYLFYSYFQANMLPSAFVGKIVMDLMALFNADETQIRELLSKARIYVDNYANNRSQTHDTTLVLEYRKLGFNKLLPMPKLSVVDGIFSMHQMIKGKRVIEHVTEFESAVEHLYMTHYPIGRTGTVTTYDHYEHDSPSFNSDLVDSLRYLMISLHRKYTTYGISATQEEKPKSRIKEIQDAMKKKRGGYAL